MSSRYGWWSYAKYLTSKYPELKREYDALHSPRVTMDTTPISIRTGGVSRSTEKAALRQLPPAKQADYDAVTQAIEQTKLLKTGQERLRVIDMVFWKQSHTVEGAAYVVNYSAREGYRFQKDFLLLVGYNRGLEDTQ